MAGALGATAIATGGLSALPPPAGAVASAGGKGGSGAAASAPADPALVERLRDMTGAAVHQCKEALRLHNGNADSAALWLLSNAPPGTTAGLKTIPPPVEINTENNYCMFIKFT